MPQCVTRCVYAASSRKNSVDLVKLSQKLIDKSSHLPETSPIDHDSGEGDKTAVIIRRWIFDLSASNDSVLHHDRALSKGD